MGFLNNVWKDAKGVVDPRNYVKAGSELVHHPIGFAKAVGKQYVDLAEHPIRTFENHPLNTLLELAPLTKLADVGTIGGALKSAGEGASAREALIRAAANNARARTSIGGLGETSVTKRLGIGLDPPVSVRAEVGATKTQGIARAQAASAIRQGLNEPTQFGQGLQFSHIKPESNAGLRHVTAQQGGQTAGHISYHQLPDGKWMVQQIRVPESLRRQGIGTELFKQAEKDVGHGNLLHQDNPGLLSAEGSAFAQSFTKPIGLTGKGSERLGRTIYQDGERVPTDPAAYNRWQNNRAVEYYAKQPEYKPKPIVNEGHGGSDLFSKNRELFDFSHEGRSLADKAAGRERPASLADLMRQMEDAHMSGNTDLGDDIANRIQRVHGFDPYSEEAPTHTPSLPPEGAPQWMAPYSMRNKDMTNMNLREGMPGGGRNALAKMLLQQQMHQRPHRPKPHSNN